MRRLSTLIVLSLTLFALTGLTACSGGSSSSGKSLDARMAAAKKNLDDAKFIGFNLTSKDLPDTTALESAHGTGTHAPAFLGEVQVKRGLSFNAPLVAVDGKVYAKLPFVSWSTIDPSDYGAPDPSTLMNRSTGISSLLTSATNLKDEGTERSGQDVLTKISGHSARGVGPRAVPDRRGHPVRRDLHPHRRRRPARRVHHGAVLRHRPRPEHLRHRGGPLRRPRHHHRARVAATVSVDGTPAGPAPMRTAPRGLLVVAAIAVGFAAADTYVVVLALPDMMASVGLGIDQLQRGAPVVSGFLLGYVTMLPLIGKVADLRGRVPVLVGSLVVFSVGSLVTAGSYDLTTIVVGRFLQGAGGGGLVPATLALVADIWAVDRRGPPLGVVGAVQELGSVVGPLYGALVIAAWSWRAIFWLNLLLGAALAARPAADGSNPTGSDENGAAVRRGRRCARSADARGAGPGDDGADPTRVRPDDRPGLHPVRLQQPVVDPDGGRVLRAGRALRRARGNRAPPAGRLAGNGVRSPGRRTCPGAVLLSLSLAGVVLAFASANPEVQVLAPTGPWLLIASALAAGAFVVRQRRARTPLVPAGSFRARAAWGALVVNLMVGAALIAALVDIPVFARVTVYPDSQLDAALVLVRLLVAIPVGALAGGYLSRRVPYGRLAAAGMTMSCLGFVLMTRWGATSLEHASPTVALVLCGLGFGVTVAPTNAALLAATENTVHGLASALLVVARMVGMLVGISALTAIGLHRFYAVSATQPPLNETCPDGTLCDAFVNALKSAGIAQMPRDLLGCCGSRSRGRPARAGAPVQPARRQLLPRVARGGAAVPGLISSEGVTSVRR